MTTVWHCFIGGATAHRTAIIQSLVREGLSTQPLATEDEAGSGVLFFDQLDERVCKLVQQLSRNGRERLLAVAICCRALMGDGSWRLLRNGASDVFAWDHSQSAAAEIAARFQRWEAVDEAVNSPMVRDNLVGTSLTWTSVLRQIIEVAIFTDSPVLITGESGTGKELVARLIHTLDARHDKRELVVLDCTTVVPELSGSEFFGHERGAFTGAIATRDGAFALADKGTLFLDEVGDLSVGLQAELLRVVQEHTYKRVGSNAWQQTDFRLVCATNRDLQHEESLGRFRRDFYYRIASWTCKLPPLRERPEDILPLAHYFLRQLRPHEKHCEIDQPVQEYLLQREYPGNIRDLRQVVSRMSCGHVGPGPISAGAIPQQERRQAEAGPSDWRDTAFEGAIRRAVALGVGLKEISQAAADTAMGIAVGDERGNLQRAAARLGVTDRALQMRRAAQRQRVNSKDASTSQ